MWETEEGKGESEEEKGEDEVTLLPWKRRTLLSMKSRSNSRNYSLIEKPDPMGESPEPTRDGKRCE